MTNDSYPLLAGGELVRNERALLSRVECGSMMTSARAVRFIVLHCSATRCDRAYSVRQLRNDHLKRGFKDIGYHFYVRRDGTLTQHRMLLEVGAHARPYNRCSIGICYEGGLDERGHPADTRTDFQKHSLRVLVMLLLRDYPGSRLCGHRDLSPDLDCNGEIEPEEWIKACPCFDAASILQDSVPPNPAYL